MDASAVWSLFGIPFGAVVGSYVTTFALRWTRNEQASTGRSHCDACRAPLGYAQTAPIVSYVHLGGRCRACAAPIDPVHLAGEVAGVVVAISAILAASPVRAALVGTLGAVLLASAVIDAKIQRLPNGLTLAAGGLAALLALLKSVETLLWGLGAAMAVTAVLSLVRWVGARRRNEPGLGLGDVKLIAALALWLGPHVFWALALASAIGLGATAVRRRTNERLAFGPMIVVAAWIVGVPTEWGWWTVTI
jgi:leader peptidase (prepilin peptidase) / N-methyltransferase